MSRYINADAIKIPNTHVDVFENCRNCKLLDEYQVREIINSAPSIDIVRCKDCKNRYYCCRGNIPLDDNGFCSQGERRASDECL